MPYGVVVGYQRFRSPPWRWRQHGPPKCWYPTTALYGITTQRTSTWNTWRWRQHRPPKRWYPTTIIHGVTTQKTLTWNIIVVKALKLAIDEYDSKVHLQVHFHFLSRYGASIVLRLVFIWDHGQAHRSTLLSGFLLWNQPSQEHRSQINSYTYRVCWNVIDYSDWKWTSTEIIWWHLILLKLRSVLFAW
jgi:hypothetical protein